MDGKGKKTRSVCPVCGGALPAGRKDMRFCSVRCKSRWHYLREGRARVFRRKLLGTLERNYRILDALLAEGMTSMTIPDLAQAGYDFSCITSYHKVGNRNEYRCFDIKYYQSGSRIFHLERVVPVSLSSGLPPSD